ncbi:hypothetical protein [Calothrix sp. 336/3]|uniref:hypothetical protein n=1 Tax=Calothrix sp. 336/3 TaxID=1337936 RepID=UPI00055266B0|nr:hypothetical protein [Calothrix sp. 336/3]AKG24374.1 hypothetical protein IJ00_00995 [Calothrix sp. 336/3]
MSNTSSRYWKIWRINPATEKLGYEKISLAIAQGFIQNQLLNIEDKDNSYTQDFLLSYFHGQKNNLDAINRAYSGLCLRCYISEPILKACKKIDSLFSGEKQFTYRDLLPFVLNDDGKKLMILDRDGKTQLIVDDNGQTKVYTYRFFSITVLQTFNTDLQSRMSLENWTYLQTKQNPELKKFLSEFGFKNLSDWALLNRVGIKQVERLSIPEQHIIKAFHSVYRRDRQMQHHRGAKRCPDPTHEQLQEMLTYLQKSQIAIPSPGDLMKELKHITLQLRQYDIWNSRESLDIFDDETQTYQTRRDLPVDSIDEEDIEQREFLQFLHQNLYLILSEAIQQEVTANIKKLQQSQKYAPFADKYIPGLQLYYCQAMSLKEITPELGMTSWDQARRILNPGELLTKVRTKTIEKMLEVILNKAVETGLIKMPPEASYIKNLSEQIADYADREVFQAAAEEIRAGKNRKMDSVYAEKLRNYMQSHCISDIEVKA